MAVLRLLRLCHGLRSARLVSTRVIEVDVERTLQDEVAAVVGRVVVAAVGVVGDAKKLFPDDLNASGPWMICAKRVTIAPAHMSGGVTRDVRGPDT